MKAQDKAELLLDKMLNNGDYQEAKRCALIAVDEILAISYFEESQMTEEDSLYRNYWQEVKTIITNY